jgi:hypothetical protein
MALPSITFADFQNGLFRISQAQVLRPDLEAFIAEKYAPFVREVIGDPAYIEIKNETPLMKDKWLDLFNGVDYFNTDADAMRTHRGLKRVVLGVIYFFWVRDSGVLNTPTGNERNKNGNSDSKWGGYFARDRYNTVIQELQNEVYPFIENYKLVGDFVDSSIDLGGNAYTINVPDTKYLYDNDLVKINGIEYTVSNVIADTSFDIVASATGLDFADSLYNYEPYKDFPLPCINASVL